MCDSIRDVYLVVGVDIVVESKLRIEEIVLLVNDIVASEAVANEPVAWVLHLHIYMAILQVEEGAETLDKLIVRFAIDIEVGLLGIVAIVLKVIVASDVTVYLVPKHISPVVTIIFVPTTTNVCGEILLVVVVDRGDSTIEVVAHLLAADEVILQLGCVQTILGIVFMALILFVVTIATGIVERSIEVPKIGEALVPDELIVLRVIVISLVVIVSAVSVYICIFATRVVATAIKALLILGCVVPCVVSFFLTIEGDELHHGVVAEVACLEKIAVQLG